MNKKVFLVVMAGLLCSKGVFGAEQIKSFTGDEMIVTATKTENKRKDITNAVLVLDEAEIKNSPAQTLGVLLANQLGIDNQTYGNYGGAFQEIQIRGMSADGTQVFVNGVNINSLSLGTADVSKIPLSNIERIEIVKGAGSLLYGSGAGGGTINIFTKRPDHDKMVLNADTFYGTQNTFGVSIAQGMPVTADLAYYLTFGDRSTDGFRDNSDLAHKNSSLNIVYDKGENLNISLYGDYTNRKFGMPGVKPPDGTADYYILGQKEFNNQSSSLLNRHEDDAADLVFRIKGKASENISYSLTSDYKYAKSYDINRSVWYGSSYKTWIINEVAGFEGNVTIVPFKGSEVLLGSEYKNYSNENSQVPLDDYGSNSGSQTDIKHSLYSKAAFTELQFRPSRFFKVEVGARQEDNSMTGTENICRYGLVINPAEFTSLKFNRGSHFKAPTMNDLFWPDDGFTKGNTNLKPETGWHTDVTLEQKLGDKMFFTAGYFKWDVKDKITWAEDPHQPTAYPGYYYWTPTNLDSYHANGVELGTVIGPLYNTALSLHYTYLDAIEEKPGDAARQSSLSQKHQIKGSLTYADKQRGLTISPTLSYMDKRPYYAAANTTSVPTEYTPSYWIVDLKVVKRIDEHWTASLEANNLFDRSYLTRFEVFTNPSNYASTISGYPGAGRSLLLTVSYAY